MNFHIPSGIMHNPNPAMKLSAFVHDPNITVFSSPEISFCRYMDSVLKSFAQEMEVDQDRLQYRVHALPYALACTLHNKPPSRSASWLLFAFLICEITLDPSEQSRKRFEGVAIQIYLTYNVRTFMIAIPIIHAHHVAIRCLIHYELIQHPSSHPALGGVIFLL